MGLLHMQAEHEILSALPRVLSLLSHFYSCSEDDVMQVPPVTTRVQPG